MTKQEQLPPPPPPPTHSCVLHFQPKMQLPGCRRQDPPKGLGAMCWGGDTDPTTDVSTGVPGTGRDGAALRVTLGEPGAGLKSESSFTSITSSPPGPCCVPEHPAPARPYWERCWSPGRCWSPRLARGTGEAVAAGPEEPSTAYPHHHQRKKEQGEEGCLVVLFSLLLIFLFFFFWH